MALNLANLQAIVTKLEADVPARIAAGTAAADAANQAAIDALTASLTNLDSAVTAVTGQPAAAPAAS